MALPGTSPRSEAWDVDGARALQRALAPGNLPDILGLELAAEYRPPTPSGSVGGDFFDVLALPGNRVAVGIGDVAGHGLAVAAAMSQVRATLRAYALEGHPPGEVARRTNQLLLAQSESAFVTCCQGELDVGRRRFRFVVAGHVPPLVLYDGGGAEVLAAPPNLPLGVLADAEYVEVETGLQPGDTIVLCTDGLVESRTVPLDDGLARLLGVSASLAAGPLDRLVAAVMARVRPVDSSDDVAVLALRYQD